MNYGGALGLIESIGLGTAAAALDAAIKTADVTCVGVEKVIGVGKMVSVTITIAGDVSAVQASVEAAEIAGNKVGTVVSCSVIARPHSDVRKLVSMFEKSKKTEEVKPEVKKATETAEVKEETEALAASKKIKK
jgi:microcompartment protein CcmL/EutN